MRQVAEGHGGFRNPRFVKSRERPRTQQRLTRLHDLLPDEISELTFFMSKPLSMNSVGMLRYDGVGPDSKETARKNV
jgi:hypothetical protein